MAFKVIDGVVYEVKEVDISGIKEEVEKVITEVEGAEKEKAEIEASMKNTNNQFDLQIEAYKKQIAGLEAMIEAIDEKRATALEPRKLRLEEIDAHIIEIKAGLIEKKEVIESLLPEESKKLGL